MSVPSRFSRDTTAERAISPFDVPSAFDPSSPRQRFVPPGWEVTTTITSHGLKAEDIVVADSCRRGCHNHRQRYPEVEAIVQMFFRVCAIVLNVSVLIIVRILDTDFETLIAVNRLYGIVTYSLFLNTLETLSLSNPQPTLLMHLFPSFFPATASTSSPNLQPRFPRLPSLCLFVCEFAALVSSVSSAILFLNPIIEDDPARDACPKATCVTQEEHDMIYGYILEVMVALVHVGFFLMAVVHWVKKMGPGWLERLER